MTQPLVSVVIPTYNHAHFLPEALQGLIDQTYPNWQAVVVNNFSSDNTEAVVAGFGDARIRLINFANHGVIAASRNQGIREAKGDYVAFLDSDDFWLPEKLARCMSRIERDKLDWVCHAERWFGDGVDKEVHYGPEAAASFDALLYRGNCISTSALIVEKSWLLRLGGFAEDVALITAEDYDLWVRLAQAGARIGFVDTVLGAYRIHENSQSRGAIRNMEATAAVVERFFATMPADTLKEKWRRRKRRGSLAYSGARALQNTRHHGEAWRLFMRALWLSPLDKRILPAMFMNALCLRF